MTQPCEVIVEGTSRWFRWDELAAATFVRRIEFRPETGSTNDDALKSAALDRPTPLLVIADAQTGGRGRGRNQWWAKDGALTFSLVVDPAAFGIEQPRWPLLSLAAALAVADTLGECAAGCHIGLKWPNDLQLNRKKVCGILVETLPGRSDRLVIGIGLNVQNSLQEAPVELRDIATSVVDETGFEWELTDVLSQLLQCLEERLKRLGANEIPLQTEWARHCVLTGRRVSLEAAGQRVEGMCRGIDANGAILLEDGGQTKSWFGGVVRVL